MRKHVSGFKGGRLAAAAGGATIVNLTVSDVAGDALDAITDPTVQDTTTVGDAIAVLVAYELWDAVARLGPRATCRRPGRVARARPTLSIRADPGHRRRRPARR